MTLVIMAVMVAMPVTAVMAPGIAIRGHVTVNGPMNMTVIRNRCISIAGISTGKTKAHVSGITGIAVRVTPDRNATSHRNSCVGAPIAGAVGQRCGGPEKAEQSKQYDD
jgi:hypothetical protein